MMASRTLAVHDSPADGQSQAGHHQGHAAHGHGRHHTVADGNAESPTTAGAYVCPMHPNVTADKPGKCPKCGMTLVATKKPKTTGAFVCSMHPDVTADKPGKCPKCGMSLVEAKE